jgi:hypothetical protein
MATDKLFTVVGTSTLNGETKVRFANDVMRVKVLAKHGHTDINLIELDTPMTKLEAVKVLKTADEFQGATEQSAIADYLDRKDEKPAKAAKAAAPAKTAKVKAPKAPAATAPAGKTHAQKAAEAALMDDAPF